MSRRNRPATKSVPDHLDLALPANIEPQERDRNNLRASIAQSAARLIADGLTDYRAAKRKAARQHGATDRDGLPDNFEIELALREHHALFARETQPHVLAALRETALRLMFRLESYSPWLVGAVLNGTANEFSEIELELVAIDAKDFERHLLNAGVRFELCNLQRSKTPSTSRTSPAIKYRFESDGAAVTVVLHDNHAARQSLHAGGGRHDRVQREDAARRFQEEGRKSLDSRP
jgi:hypothetical protein